MGRFLGHFIAVDGKSRERHKELLQKVYRMMEGWKLISLSRASRLILAQAVIGSMPIFNMQLECLPNWVHKELDKAARKCGWGGAEGKMGMHFLS